MPGSGVPPFAVTVISPSSAPKHVTSESAVMLVDNAVGSSSIISAVSLHPLLSVTTTT